MWLFCHWRSDTFMYAGLIQFRAVRQMYVNFFSIYGRYATQINTIQFNIDLINFYNVVGWTYEYESSAQKYLQSNKKVWILYEQNVCEREQCYTSKWNANERVYEKENEEDSDTVGIEPFMENNSKTIKMARARVPRATMTKNKLICVWTLSLSLSLLLCCSNGWVGIFFSVFFALDRSMKWKKNIYLLVCKSFYFCLILWTSVWSLLIYVASVSH